MVAVPALEALLGRVVGALVPGLVFLGTVLAVYLPGRYLLVPGVRRVMNLLDVNDTFQLPFLKVLRVTVIGFAALTAASVSQLADFLAATEAITAAATIALGFASKDVLGNLVSGVFIVLDPTYNIGDWIRWNDREGIIEDISFRVTRIHTFDNELVTVPNSVLTTNTVVNPVAKDRRRVAAEFGIGYEDDIDQARAILVDTARENDEILRRPAPSVRLDTLGESAVQLTIRFWIDQPARTDFVRIRSTYTQTVKERFDEAGIEMPYPYRQLTGRVETGTPGPASGHSPTADPGDPD